MKMTAAHRILVGIIGAPHGIKGELRVKTFTAEPTALGAYGPLTVEGRPGALTVISLRPLRDDMVVARFAEVTDRTLAESLTNRRLYVDRAALPAPDEDEFYNADLIGLCAETETGRDLGRVIGVVNFGAGDLLEIAPPAGSAAETVLVSFTKAFVPIVDVAGGRLVVTEGALVDDADDDAYEEQA